MNTDRCCRATLPPPLLLFPPLPLLLLLLLVVVVLPLQPQGGLPMIWPLEALSTR